MPTKGTSVKGIRLPDDVWAELDAAAREMGMTRNEYIGRLLTKRFSAACEVRKSYEIGRDAHQKIDWSGDPDGNE